MKQHINDIFDRITVMGVMGAFASWGLQDWSIFASLLVAIATFLYVFTNWLFLLRSWWVKEKVHREGRKKPSGFVPLDESK